MSESSAPSHNYLQLAQRRLIQHRSDQPSPADPSRYRFAARPYLTRPPRRAPVAAPFVPFPAEPDVPEQTLEILQPTETLATIDLLAVDGLPPTGQPGPTFLQQEFGRLRDQQNRPRKRRLLR